MSQSIAALSWPHFAFLFGVIFVLLFRAQIGALLSRVTSIDKSGIRTQAMPDAQSDSTKRYEAAQELLLAIGDTVVLKEVEARIRADLESRKLDTAGETSRVLVKYLAATMCFLEFEQIHSSIFSSQIDLLRRLNQVQGTGQTLADVEQYFGSVQLLYAPVLDDWTTERYLSFLFSKNLIASTGDRLHLTHLGNEYLVWMAKSGKSEGTAL